MDQTQTVEKIKGSVPPDFAAADATNKRESDFDALSGRIKAVGGIAAPEQRLQVADSLQAVQPETSVLRAMAQAFLGNPNARHIASQGRITTSTVYDVNGDPVLATFAENSSIPIKAVDLKTNAELGYKDWANRKLGQFANYKDTFGGEAQKISTKERAEYNELESGITNLQDAASGHLSKLYSEQRKAFQELGDVAKLDGKTLERIASMTSGTASYSSSISDAYNTMKQAQQDKATKDALSKSGKLGAAISLLASAGKVSKEKVESASSSDLDQIYKNAGSSQGIEASFNQTQKEAANSAWYQALDDNGKRLIENIFQRAKNIDQLNAQASKLGDLSIAANPYTPEVLLQAGAGELQAALGEFKAKATQAFAEWRKEQIQRYPAGQLPAKGELQSAFTRSAAYQGLLKEYDGVMDDIESRSKANVEKHKGTSPSQATIGGIGISPDNATRPQREQVTRNNAPAPEAKKSSEDKVKALTQSILNSLNKK